MPSQPDVYVRGGVPVMCATEGGRADFSGRWEMDLVASDKLGAILRELGLNPVLASVVTRLPVKETISQQGDAVVVRVTTRISESVLELRPGELTYMPGIAGGTAAAISTWLDEARLKTVQALDGTCCQPDEPSADTFVTVRSLRDGRSSLVEECSVLRGGVLVPGCSARRILRRVAL